MRSISYRHYQAVNTTIMKDTILFSTRKGLIIYKRINGKWKYDRTDFIAIPVSLSHIDRNTGSWWACLDHGHWGCKLHYSTDQGKSWVETDAPRFPEGSEITEGVPATVKYLWAMASGGKDQPGKLWLGTEPGGLFMSDDNGKSFHLNKALWEHPSRKNSWMGGGRDNAGIHSIIVDPADSDHMYVGISVAGVFETTDGGASWHPKNKGLRADFLPDPEAEVGHDPHLLVECPGNPVVMWQQNHCGIFMSTDGAKTWKDVSEKEGPANFGFAVAVDEKDGNNAWVVPAVSDEKRIAINEALCVCRTENGGKTWTALREGLPQESAYDIVYRHALAKQQDELIFGTTTGNAYYSADRGDHWEELAGNLPMVYAVEFA